MRLDIYLSKKGLAKSRSYAAELIKNKCVKVNGITVDKPSFDVAEEGERVEVSRELYSFVGRGGIKLEAAINFFGLDITGAVAVDVGASTGGFTDCLLRKGASKVYAVDSGHGQLHMSLRNDERVINMEGCNARLISPSLIGETCSVAVCDLSFISQTYIIENVYSVLCDGGIFITLIKPQFECGKNALSKGGIVRDGKYHAMALRKVCTAAVQCGFSVCGIIRSPITGGDGNTEFLAYMKKGGVNSDFDKYIHGALMSQAAKTDGNQKRKK